MRLVSVLTAVAAILPALTDASRLTPPVLPLIVRNPYLSTWLPNARGKPWEQWPMFWTGEHIGFSVIASLPEDRTAYPLLGRSQDSLGEHGDGYNVSFPTYLGSKYDASTTNLSYVLDSHKSSKQVEITLSFLSPITPTSTVRQSIPAAYLNVFVNGDLDVDIYLDLNGQWVTGDRGNEIVWDLENVPLDSKKDHGLKTWMFRRKVEQYFTETRDQSEWGTLCFSGPSDVRHEAGTSALLRQRFSRTGTLQNTADSRFRGVMDEEPVFAFAKSFKASNAASSGPTTQSVMFTIAHIQNPVVQYAAARGLTQLRPLWSSYMPTPKELITFHYLDYDHVKELADQYATQLFKDAYNSGSDDYVDIVAVSARQVMGATHFLGTPEDPLLFMKEISSDGNTQTIDVIFPAFPFFLYTNPRWLAYLLEPLIEHMLSGQYPNDYAMHDLGASYPNATGHPDGNDEYMPVEECGNILIMGLALANSIKYGTNTSVESWQPDAGYRAFDKDGFKVFPLNTGSDAHIKYIDEPWSSGKESQHQAQKWVQRSYTLWKQWTGYLVKYGLRPHNQLSTDDFAGWLALQTNLALKGIIGIKAMSGLAEIAGKKEDVITYENTSRVYIEKWEEYGISRDKTHAKVAYNWFGSWTTTYNLYADTLLCFHLEGSDDGKAIGMGDQKPINGHKPAQGFVPQHIYQMQSDWYFAVRQKYGLPLDSRHFYTKTDWEFFSMAVAAPRVRADILQSVAKWVNETSTDRPLTDLHDTEGTGGFPGPNFFARPVIGGHFAFLSLEKACGGKAIGGLDFLRDDVVDREALVNVAGLLELEVLEEWALNGEL